MSGLIFLALAPVYAAFWRKEIVNLVGDCIAAGIKRSRQ